MIAGLVLIGIAYLAAVVVVGMPAILLKLAAVRLLDQDPAFSPNRLLKRSILGCLLAGFATTLAIVFSGGATSPLWITGVMPQEAIAVATILLATIPLDAAVWYGRAVPSNLRTPRSTATWLLGSNLWLLWAIFLMIHFGSKDLATSCTFLDEIGATADEPACLAAPRSFWLVHPEMHLAVEALPYSD